MRRVFPHDEMFFASSSIHDYSIKLTQSVRARAIRQSPFYLLEKLIPSLPDETSLVVYVIDCVL